MRHPLTALQQVSLQQQHPRVDDRADDARGEDGRRRRWRGAVLGLGIVGKVGEHGALRVWCGEHHHSAGGLVGGLGQVLDPSAVHLRPVEGSDRVLADEARHADPQAAALLPLRPAQPAQGHQGVAQRPARRDLEVLRVNLVQDPAELLRGAHYAVALFVPLTSLPAQVVQDLVQELVGDVARVVHHSLPKTNGIETSVSGGGGVPLVDFRGGRRSTTHQVVVAMASACLPRAPSPTGGGGGRAGPQA
mmetsp:Transcript_7611/g.27624  ORF Transcript_7611/g.27624 Transcript_7611/m.27624 type:complete len:248 (-) Transcript_7611:376-1119(-)